MSRCVSGSISKDFPLYHSARVPIYESSDERKYIHKEVKERNIYTNEHPDIFRLKGMKEGGYVNPFLDKIIKVDRSEQLKKLSSDRKNVNFIDFIKTNRKYSQDPKIIRYISTDVDMQLKHKRMGKTNISIDNIEENEDNKKTKINLNKNIILTDGNTITNNKKYNNFIKKLNYFMPKIDYRIKRTLDIEDKGNKRNLSINYEKEKDSLYKKFFNGIDPKLSYNLRNLNGFEFESNDKVKKNDEVFNFKRKQIYKYNPIKDRMETINPPPYKNPRWSPFLENYFLLMDTHKQFQRKGGLFSEFSNKNIGTINNNKFELQQKLKKEKEEKVEKEEKEKNNENKMHSSKK